MPDPTNPFFRPTGQSILPRFLNLSPQTGQGGQTNPFAASDNDWAQYLPTVPEVQGEVQQQRDDHPWWDRIFEFMDQATFGQAIKGLFHGAANGPWEALSEGVRNLPFLYYAAGTKQLAAADVREAWGDTNARGGWKNILFNTVGDIVLSPGLMFGAPFGLVKGAGSIGKIQEGISGLAQAGKGAEAINAVEKGVHVLAAEATSLKIGMETGARALWTLKLPGMSSNLLSIGRVIPGVNPTGFQSFGIGLGNAVDRFFGILHSNPLLRPVASVLTYATGIADPKKRGIFSAATKEAQTVAIATMQSFKDILEGSTTPGFREWLFRQPGVNDAFMTMAQTFTPSGIQNVASMTAGELQHTLPFESEAKGFLKLDDRASFKSVVMSPHIAIGLGKRDSLLRNDSHFVDLWNGAEHELLQDIGEPTPFINAIAKEYPTIPLEPAMLRQADIQARIGVEKSVLDEVTYPEKLMGAIGKAEVQPGAARGQLPFPEAAQGADRLAGMRARADIGRATREKVEGVFQGARDKTMASYDLLQRDVAAGKVSWDQVEQYLTTRFYAMEAMSRMETIGGILGDTLEPAVGPYIHRVANPVLLKTIDDQFIRGVKREGGQKAMNIISSFMKDPSYSSLTTTEANAVFWEIGTKLLGYKPLKDIVSGAEHGIVDRLKAKIFDLPFIRALKKEGNYDAANFFLTNPVLNDYSRFWESAGQQGMRALFGILRDSPMSERIAGNDPLRAETIMRAELDEGKVIVAFNQEPKKILETQGVGQMVGHAWSKERTAQAGIARGQVADDVAARLKSGTVDTRSEIGHLDQAVRTVHEDASATALKTIDTDNLGVAILKMKARELAKAKMEGRVLDVLGGSSGTGLDRMAADLRRLPTRSAAQERFLLEHGNLDQMWAKEGVQGQEMIRARLARANERRANVALQLDAENKRIGDVMGIPQEIPEGGYAFKVNELRLRDTLATLDESVAADRELLTTKFKDRETFMARSVADKVGEVKLRQESLRGEYATYRDEIKEEIGSLKEHVAQTAAQIKFEGKMSKSDIARARNQKQLAMDNNINIAALQEIRRKGMLALNEIPAYLREKLVASDHDLYAFAKEDWAAITRFHDHFVHADDWGQNKIVQALRAMKNVWAPYTAANAFGIQTQIRNFVTNHLMLEWGGMEYRTHAYQSAHGILRGMRKVFDKEMPAEEFAATPLNIRNPHPDLPPDATFGDIVPFIQSRALLGSAGFVGELVNTGGDMLALSRRGGKAIKEQLADKPWKLLTDLPAAFFPYKKATDSVYGQVGMKMAGWGDDMARVAGFVDALDRGMSLSEAADHVMKWTYDSRRNLTALERQRIATFIPFYSFAKFATARSVETFLKRPGSIAWINTFRDNAFKSVYAEKDADPADLDLVMPKYISKAFGVPVRNGPKGPEFFMLGSFLPTQQIQQLVGAMEGFGKGLGEGIGNVADYAAEQMHPAIRLAIENMRNRSFYYDEPLEKFPGQTEEFFGMSLPKRGMLFSGAFLRSFRYLWNLDKHNLLGLSEGKALLHGVATEDEPSYLSRYADSIFGLVPPLNKPNLAQSIRFQKMDGEQRLGDFASLLKNRVERGGIVGEKDAETLSDLLKKGVAEMARVENVQENVYPSPPAPKRTRRRIGKMTEELVP